MFKQILTGAAAGAAVTAGISYLATPVYAPGVMMWAANMGLISGALGGVGVGCMTGGMNARSSSQREAYGLGAVMSLVGFLFVGTFSLVDTLFSIEPDIEGELEKKVIAIYGEDFSGARDGDVVKFEVPIFGEQTESATATFNDMPVGEIYTGSSTLQFKVCASLDVELDNAQEDVQQYSICNERPLTKKEIQRIVPSFN